MDQKIKRRWLTALRSKKYKQGDGQLRSDPTTVSKVTRYCCLGVLCEVMKVPYVGTNGVPESEVLMVAGLTGNDVKGHDIVFTLTEMNDGKWVSGKIKRSTFRGIATWIEKNL